MSFDNFLFSSFRQKCKLQKIKGHETEDFRVLLAAESYISLVLRLFLFRDFPVELNEINFITILVRQESPTGAYSTHRELCMENFLAKSYKILVFSLSLSRFFAVCFDHRLQLLY